jgi:preprotein translocase subunit SecE
MAEINENEMNEVPAEETSITPVKKPKKEQKKQPNGFVRAMKRCGKFFRDVVSELKKVVWTPKSEVKKSSIIVIVSVVAFAIVIGLIDLGGRTLVDTLAGLYR